MVLDSIFREYDIRGIFQDELNEESVKLIGYMLGKKIIQKGLKNVSIGYDARTHSTILSDYLTSGLNKADCKVFNMGLVATPINYFGNYININIDASIMITGSHNPSNYNGFKITIDKKPFFGDDIYNLRDEILESDIQKIDIPDNIDSVKIDVKSRYIEYITKEFSFLKNLDKKIVIDCGNGVADTAITEIFDNLNLNYKALYATPDGTFPNHHPDPTIEKNLIDIKKELENDFEIGFAYDGDADRIAVLTKNNNIKGDILAMLFSSQMKNPIVVGEVKCSQIMYDKINSYGKAYMYKTGHSNLKVKLKELNADLAAEVSGHIFFNDKYFGFDDALYATFRVLELLYNGMNLDDEVEKLPKVYSTEEIKVSTTEDEKFILMKKIGELLKNIDNLNIEFPKIKDIIEVDGLRVNFENGWGLVRASNTTPVLVTRFESKNIDDAKLYENSLNNLIKKAKEEL